jgi:ferric-dicitrate binding protein FerR (iron transport regulator)
VSKERARRRAEREAAAALRAARQARRDRWRQLSGLDRVRRLRAGRTPASGRRPPSSALGRQRARQNGLLLAVLVPLNAVYWLLQPSWPWRIGALVASVLAWPLLVVVLFDRRASR